MGLTKKTLFLGKVLQAFRYVSSGLQQSENTANINSVQAHFTLGVSPKPTCWV